jgi:membrane fusion protein
MDRPFFRPECQADNRRSWLGGISLVQPPSLWAAALFAACAASAIALLLFFGEYTRRSRVTGQLVPDRGLAIVVAPISGVLTQRVPEEGEPVARDQKLVMIAVPAVTASGRDLGAARREELSELRNGIEAGYRSQDQLLAVQAKGAQQRLGSAREELRQVEAMAATRRRQAELADATLARFRSLAARHYVSELQLQQQEQAVLDQHASAQELQQQVAAARRNVAQLEQALGELPIQKSAGVAARLRDLAELEGERLRVEADGEVIVPAPVTGVVTSRLAQPGQSVQAGQALLSVLPAGSRLQAQLLVPSSAVGFIAPGDTVLLRYQAYPYQKFGHGQGTVARISRSALGRDELESLGGNARTGEAFYRVIVTLSRETVTAYGRSEPLRPGMTLEADILGEKRRLYEWILEPVYSLQGKL